MCLRCAEKMSAEAKPSIDENNTAAEFEFDNGTAARIFGQSTLAKPVTSDFGQQNILFGDEQQFGGFDQEQQNAPLFQSLQGNTSLLSTNGFGPNKLALFRGAQVSSLFGTTSTPPAITTGVFESLSLSNGLFGNYQKPYCCTVRCSGTGTVRYQPSHGTYTLIKSGYLTHINTKQHCITAMKDYESNSLEELRLADYLNNRKDDVQIGQATAFFVFGKQALTGTVFVKYQPSEGTYTQVKNGNLIRINIIQHCITTMKDYESKSLEELRFEDYLKIFGDNQIFGSKIPTRFNQTSNEFKLGASLFNKRFQGNTASTSKFGNSKTTQNKGICNTFNNLCTLPGNPQPTQKNEESFGKAKHTNIFSFNQPTSQQKNKDASVFPVFDQHKAVNGKFNFVFTSQPNQPFGDTPFFNNKPKGPYRNKKSKNIKKTFVTSNSGNDVKMTAPTICQEVRKGIPLTSSSAFKDLKSSGMPDDMLKASHSAANMSTKFNWNRLNMPIKNDLGAAINKKNLDIPSRPNFIP